MAKTKKAARPERSNAQQSRYLMGRIERCYYTRPSKEVDPPAVAAARRVVEKFEASQRTKRDAAQRKWSMKVKAAKDAVLFKTPKEALAAVEKLEVMCKAGG